MSAKKPRQMASFKPRCARVTQSEMSPGKVPYYTKVRLIVEFGVGPILAALLRSGHRGTKSWGLLQDFVKNAVRSFTDSAVVVRELLTQRIGLQGFY